MSISVFVLLSTTEIKLFFSVYFRHSYVWNKAEMKHRNNTETIPKPFGNVSELSQANYRIYSHSEKYTNSETVSPITDEDDVTTVMSVCHTRSLRMNELMCWLICTFIQERALKGNWTLKNISPKININDKWIHVSVIKLTMQIRYRIILTIKLLISHNVFLHGGRSSKPSSLFLYLCLFVDVDMVTKNGCSYVFSCV